MPIIVRPISIKLRPDEREALRTAAAEANIGPSSFAADAVRKALGTKRRRAIPQRTTEIAAAIRAATGEIGRIGNLLNQLARHANAGGRVAPQALDDIRAQVAVLDARLEQVLQL